ncbi:hypothetical protein FIM12_07040 [SAR202 cluster bacterium AD-804-J14_MRT_500m]|nr:hypothetical protein [SAR202 cluster bacterium AD-804-J14_MRT_500m]
MARLNKIIDLLENGKPAIGTFVNSGNMDDLAFVTDAGYDFVIVENEHQGLDFPLLRLSLQSLLSRKKIVEHGTLQADPTPLVRVAPNSREQNQWILKQTLDAGAYGLVLPVTESVEAAQAAVVACRYPQKEGDSQPNPKGERGWHPQDIAVRYWGVGVEEYYEKSDLWPLDPSGEMILMALVETVKGVANIGDILDQVKGIGAVFAGPGDLSIDMGLGGDASGHPKVQEALLKVLDQCRSRGIACATGVASEAELDKRAEQGFNIFIDLPEKSTATLQHLKSK